MATSVRTRTGGYHEAAHTLLRESLLDAAGRLMEQAPWSEISMAAIAGEAGVSRQTLYNEFGSRDVFAQAFALRAADRFLCEVEDAFAAAPEAPIEALESGFRRFLDLAAEDPMVHHIVVRDPGADELLALFTTRGGPVVEMGAARLKERMLENWPDADADRAAILAEGLMRLGISHAGLPTVDRPSAAKNVAELLGPFISEHIPS